MVSAFNEFWRADPASASGTLTCCHRSTKMLFSVALFNGFCRFAPSLEAPLIKIPVLGSCFQWILLLHSLFRNLSTKVLFSVPNTTLEDSWNVTNWARADMAQNAHQLTTGPLSVVFLYAPIMRCICAESGPRKKSFRGRERKGWMIILSNQTPKPLRPPFA